MVEYVLTCCIYYDDGPDPDFGQITAEVGPEEFYRGSKEECERIAARIADVYHEGKRVIRSRIKVGEASEWDQDPAFW